MAWIGGIFSDRIYHPSEFDTGEFVEEEMMAPPDRAMLDKYRLYQQVLREDEEILEIICNSVTSGLLEH